MKIGYATHNTVPAQSAAALNMFQMCNALGRQTGGVISYFPWKFWRVRTWSSSSKFFGPKSFKERRIVDLPRFHNLYDILTARRMKDDGINLGYCRKFSSAAAVIAQGIPSILEIHSMYDLRRWGKIGVRLMTHSHFLRLVVLNKLLLDDVLLYIGDDNFNLKEKIIVAHDAVDLSKFNNDPAMVGRGNHVGYFGTVSIAKGVGMIVEIAKSMPDVSFHLVGRVTTDFANHPDYPSNLLVYGFLQHQDAIAVMRAMDVLLLPNPPIMVLDKGDDIGRYTSPMKLFEYMASNRPIIASDIPAVKEILDKECAELVDHDDKEGWIGAIASLMQDKKKSRFLAEKAFERVKMHTFDARVTLVMKGINVS